MDNTIMLDKNELEEAFKRVIKRDPVKKVLDNEPYLLMFTVMLNVELEKELFKKGGQVNE